MLRSALPAFAILVLAGCGSNGVVAPSLQPRAGELVDPRVPVDRPMNERPASASLVNRLDGLVAQARSGENAFEQAIAAARRAAQTAGARQSEGWIAAQELLSAAIEARRPVATALGSIDGLAAALLAEQGGLAPSDKQAIDDAAAAVAAIDSRQSAAVQSVKSQLGD